MNVELRFVSIESGKDIRPAIIHADVTVTANGTTSVMSGEINNLADEPHVLAARILDSGVTISRDVDWPQPFKYLSFAGRGVKVEAQDEHYVVSVERPTKGIVFEEGDETVLSDNCLDVVPGDPQKVNFRGKKSKPRYRYLGMEESQLA